MVEQMLMQRLLNQLQRNNPQAYGVVQQAMQGGVNPADMLKQITRSYSPEQMNSFFEQARQFGIPENIINQVRY